ncbi:MAG: RNaseH domain-containing protein [Xenococcaceae cyanobacterium MO_207.B15]|nr:RNaseH domain-containing protein [Xenococcaceae cyanobacterium MO_207.B15]
MTTSQELNVTQVEHFKPNSMNNISEPINIILSALLIQDKLYKLALPPIKKYILLGQAKTLETITLAFTVPDNLSPVTVNGFTLSWTKEALANLSQVHEDVKEIKNLPYASLRGLVEFKLSNISRIVPDLGLNSYTVKQQKQQSFAYINGGTENKIEESLKPILNDWLENYLVLYGQREGVSEDAIERLRELQEENKLLSIKPFQSQIFPWGWDKDSGTTQSKDKLSFPQFADYIARLVSGNEIFQGLGKIKRIITSQGGMTSGIVKLFTDSISIDNKGLFSLYIEFELVTYPSLHQPLLTLDVSKRRWLSSLKEDGYSPNSINGYIFSKNHQDRIFNFKLNRRPIPNTDKWEWQPDSSFSVLQRELNLPLEKFNGEQIANGAANTDDCKVVLTYSDSDSNQSHDIKAGVPEKDQLEAFRSIEKILKPQGIKPFDSYSKVKITHSKKDKDDVDAASKQINKPTLLNAVVEFLDNPNISNFTPKYLCKKTDAEINELLEKHFGFNLSEKGLKLFRFNSNNLDQYAELKHLIQLNKEAVERLYPAQKPLLIIFHENQNQYSLKLLQTIINILWGNSIEIQWSRLPENTHGAKNQLPGNELNNQERSQQRIEAWRDIAEKVAKIKRPKFCLVMAREFYPNPENEDKPFHDDKVNKPSTRKALASIGRTCVQFIIPPSIWKHTGDVNLSDFIFPAQSSIKDLLWAHSGRIDGIKEKVDRYFKNIKPKNRPKEIIAITIERKNGGRKRGRLENTFLPIAIKTNGETGLSEICCCYENSKIKNLVITPWKPFNETLFDIAAISPVSLGKDKNNKYLRHERFQEFVEKIISNSVQEHNNPVVMIDSSNCVQLWNWLSDRRMNTTNIDINKKTNMQENWQGARIIRIRQDLAPGIIEDKVKYLVETSLDDTRTKKELEADKDKQIKISAPSGQISGLYKLKVKNSTGCIPYLSIGKKTVHQNQRGASCYREIEQDKLLKVKVTDKNGNHSYEKVTNKAGLKIKTLKKQKPYTDQWATPNPLEIVVTLLQEEDNPDNIAGFIESLRYGYGHFNEWTKLPSPLFFERVVRDYISAFKLQEGEETED